jgi:hypothetical protein
MPRMRQRGYRTPAVVLRRVPETRKTTDRLVGHRRGRDQEECVSYGSGMHWSEVEPILRATYALLEEHDSISGEEVLVSINRRPDDELGG